MEEYIKPVSHYNTAQSQTKMRVYKCPKCNTIVGEKYRTHWVDESIYIQMKLQYECPECKTLIDWDDEDHWEQII